jgi:hypothetical protein
MPSFRTEVPHPFEKDDATEKLKVFLEIVAERYRDQVSHLNGEWRENILSFALTSYGFTVSGTLTVEDYMARLEGQLPLAALALRGKIEQSIAQELRRALT